MLMLALKKIYYLLSGAKKYVRFLFHFNDPSSLSNSFKINEQRELQMIFIN